jgi:hypothetical protein
MSDMRGAVNARQVRLGTALPTIKARPQFPGQPAGRPTGREPGRNPAGFRCRISLQAPIVILQIRGAAT